MYLLGFITCLGLTIVAIQLLAKGLEGILQSTGINIINKFFGGVLMSAIFVLMYSVLLWFTDKSHLLKEEQKAQSATYSLLEQYPGQVKAIWVRVAPNFKDFWEQTLDFIDKMEQNTIQKDSGKTEIYDIEDDAPKDDEY
jgi:membrane protein required for colicin V production